MRVKIILPLFLVPFTWGLFPDHLFEKNEVSVSNNKLVIIDERDGQAYGYVRIGDLFWLDRNLNYNSPDSECYGNDDENCSSYGRMYSYEKSKSACPKGWHLPTTEEWESLKKIMRSKKADKIIVPGVWKDDAFKNASNELNLNILPGGRKDNHIPSWRDDYFGELGISSSYWLEDQEYHWHIRYGKSHIHKHGDLRTLGSKFYIRCVCETDALNQQ